MATSTDGGKKKKHVSKYSDAIRTRNKKRNAEKMKNHLEKAAARKMRNHPEKVS